MWAAVLLSVSVLVALLALVWDSSEISWAGAVLLGLVEGVTEYLPISSTGHLAVVVDLVWPDIDQEAIDSYVIVIQARHSPFVIELSEEDRSQLEALARSQTAERRMVTRAEIGCWRPMAWRI